MSSTLWRTLLCLWHKESTEPKGWWAHLEAAWHLHYSKLLFGTQGPRIPHSNGPKPTSWSWVVLIPGSVLLKLDALWGENSRPEGAKGQQFMGLMEAVWACVQSTWMEVWGRPGNRKCKGWAQEGPRWSSPRLHIRGGTLRDPRILN